MARKITILLVEADAAVRDALQSALTSENYQVTTADNPDQAWTKLETQRIDLALLDADFGGSDRSSFLRRLRQSYPTLCTILMSGAGELNLFGEGWDWMEKPLNLPLLFGKIDELAVEQR